MSDVYVSSVMFTEAAIEVTFMVLPDDVRCDALLVATRSYTITHTHPRFGEEVRDVTRQLTELVEDVHQAFPGEPLTYRHDDEDELGGMGE